MIKLQVNRNGQWRWVQGYLPNAGIILADNPYLATPVVDEQADEVMSAFQKRFPHELFQLKRDHSSLEENNV